MSWWKVVLNKALSILTWGKQQGLFMEGHGPDETHDVRDRLRPPR